jgi:transposase
VIKIISISEEEKQELERMSREERGTVALRAQLILWSYNDKHGAEELRLRMGWKIKRVRKWLKRFLKEGSAGLYDVPHTGRKQIATQNIMQDIASRLDNIRPPEETRCNFWTIGLLASFVQIFYGLKVHADTVRRWVHKLGFSFKRPQYAPAPSTDKKAEEKIQRICEVYKEKKEEDHILYEDESSVFLLPLLRSLWSRIGQQIKILTYSSWNVSLKIFGAVNAHGGKFCYKIYEKNNTESFIDFLEHLLEVYSAGKIYMILDNATYHRSKKLKRWLQDHSRIELIPLPTRSPRLNPIEKIWWYVKPEISGNRWLGNIENLRARIIDTLGHLSQSKILELTHLSA